MDACQLRLIIFEAGACYMKKVNIGVIGVGIQGEHQVKCFRSITNADVVAVSDRNVERAKKIAEEYHVPKTYGDYHDLAADPEIELVSVCTPDHLHFEPSISAIENGKHLLVEKPLATDVSEAERIVSEARKHGVKLMLNFSNRWSPPFRLARKTIEEGKTGKLIHAYARLSDTIFVPTEMIKWSRQTSVLWFLGSHVFDLLRWFFNDEAKKVFGVSRSTVLESMGIPVQDFYESLIEFRGGGVAVMENSWILPRGEPFVVDFKMDVFGERAAIRIDRSHHGSLKIIGESKAEFPDVYVLPDEGVSGFVREGLQSFVRSVAEGVEPPVLGEDGLAVTKVISSIIKSAESGHPISLE